MKFQLEVILKIMKVISEIWMEKDRWMEELRDQLTTTQELLSMAALETTTWIEQQHLFKHQETDSDYSKTIFLDQVVEEEFNYLKIS